MVGGVVMARRGAEADLELLFLARELVAVADQWREREPQLSAELLSAARRALVEVVDKAREARAREE